MQDLVCFLSFFLFQEAFYWRENVCDHNFLKMKIYFLNIICKIFILFIRENDYFLGRQLHKTNENITIVFSFNVQ